MKNKANVTSPLSWEVCVYTRARAQFGVARVRDKETHPVEEEHTKHMQMNTCGHARNNKNL